MTDILIKNWQIFSIGNIISPSPLFLLKKNRFQPALRSGLFFAIMRDGNLGIRPYMPEYAACSN
jgi:hypothetical protein